MHRSVLIDGCQRSYITLPGYRKGKKPANAGHKYPAEVLTREEVSRLLAACSRRGTCGIRNRALIVVMWRAGLRIAETLALRPKDIDLDAGTITILHGKGDRRRTVGIDPQALAVIEQWMIRRREIGIGPGRPVFCTISGSGRGRALGDSYVREALKDLAAKCGIEKRVHPHGFRHTHAAELALEGIPVHVIRRQLGHGSLATTERYIDHLTPLEVISAIQRRAEWFTHGSSPPVGEQLVLEHDGAIPWPGAEHRPRSPRVSVAAAP